MNVSLTGGGMPYSILNLNLVINVWLERGGGISYSILNPQWVIIVWLEGGGGGISYSIINGS